MVGGCAPRLAEDIGMSPDEAVSLTGTVLPRLDRRRRQRKRAAPWPDRKSSIALFLI